MEEQPGAKPDYLMEAARAHASAAKVWEALVERDRLLSASSKASEGARAAARAVGGPAARLVKAAALRALPPVPKALALGGTTTAAGSEGPGRGAACASSRPEVGFAAGETEGACAGGRRPGSEENGQEKHPCADEAAVGVRV